MNECVMYGNVADKVFEIKSINHYTSASQGHIRHHSVHTLAFVILNS